jgi:hypothetical protein
VLIYLTIQLRGIWKCLENSRFERAATSKTTLHYCEMIFPFDVNFIYDYKEKYR